MDDFNSLYSDYQQAFAQGHHDGSRQAHQQTQIDLKEEAQKFTLQFGKELALYETFLTHLKLTQQKDSLKIIKKIHSPIILQKCNELSEKMEFIVQKLNSCSNLCELDYSIQILHLDRKELKSKFQVVFDKIKTVISILGLKQYEKRALEKRNDFQKKHEEGPEIEDELQF